MQRPEPRARTTRGVGVAGTGKRQVRIDVCPRADQRIPALDVLEARFHQRDGCDGSAGDGGRRGGG